MLLFSCSVGLTHCDHMNCSPPGSSGTFQARILEQVYSRASSCFRDWTFISCVYCIGRWILTTESSGKPLNLWQYLLIHHILTQENKDFSTSMSNFPALCIFLPPLHFCHLHFKLLGYFTFTFFIATTNSIIVVSGPRDRHFWVSV